VDGSFHRRGSANEVVAGKTTTIRVIFAPFEAAAAQAFFGIFCFKIDDEVNLSARLFS
jgi:hypothetical protein